MEEAMKKCKDDSHGHTGYAGLVTIWNEHESQFIQSMFQGVDHKRLSFILDKIVLRGAGIFKNF